jgi:mono/diheme cytochrome c family protein
MADQPSPPAAAGPRSPAAGSIPIEASGPVDRTTADAVTNPLPTDDAVMKGEALYRIYCVPCHEGPVAPYFPKMPSLADPSLQSHGDGWWYATITNGTSLMPAYGHELDPDERWAIVRFARTLPRP